MAIRLARHTPRRKGEPTIALINIIFLMLIFFLIAGTLAPPLNGELSLINVADLEGREPPNALVILADGRMTFKGQVTTIEEHFAFRRNEALDMEVGETENQETDKTLLSIRIVPDRELQASELIRIANELRTNGAGRVVVVTEKAP